MFTFKKKNENQLIKKNESEQLERDFKLSYAIKFFENNLHIFQEFERQGILPITKGVSLSIILEDLIIGHNLDLIFDLEELPIEQEVN